MEDATKLLQWLRLALHQAPQEHARVVCRLLEHFEPQFAAYLHGARAVLPVDRARQWDRLLHAVLRRPIVTLRSAIQTGDSAPASPTGAPSFVGSRSPPPLTPSGASTAVRRLGAQEKELSFLRLILDLYDERSSQDDGDDERGRSAREAALHDAMRLAVAAEADFGYDAGAGTVVFAKNSREGGSERSGDEPYGRDHASDEKDDTRERPAHSDKAGDDKANGDNGDNGDSDDDDGDDDDGTDSVGVLPAEQRELDAALEALRVRMTTSRTISLVVNAVSKLLLADIDRRSLVLARMRLGSIESVCFSAMRFVRALDLSHNGLSALPDAIGTLALLCSLNIANNRLTSLPAGLCDLTDLETLHARHNRITALPAAFGVLVHLRVCDLANNRLSELPVSAVGLVHLRYLNLRANLFSKPPFVLAALPLVSHVILAENPITASMLTPRPQADIALRARARAAELADLAATTAALAGLGSGSEAARPPAREPDVHELGLAEQAHILLASDLDAREDDAESGESQSAAAPSYDTQVLQAELTRLLCAREAVKHSIVARLERLAYDGEVIAQGAAEATGLSHTLAALKAEVRSRDAELRTLRLLDADALRQFESLEIQRERLVCALTGEAHTRVRDAIAERRRKTPPLLFWWQH